VVATRDYHPIDHVSFVPKGPFPAHCIQGTPGACFLKPIAKAMADCMREGGDVAVAFKGMHEDIDSFGAMPYYDGGIGASGEPRISRSVDVPPEAGLPTCMGCAAAPWTVRTLQPTSSPVSARRQRHLRLPAPARGLPWRHAGRRAGMRPEHAHVSQARVAAVRDVRRDHSS
jgi:hypothetical protein